MWEITEDFPKEEVPKLSLKLGFSRFKREARRTPGKEVVLCWLRREIVWSAQCDWMGWVVGAEPGAMGGIHFTKGIEWHTKELGLCPSVAEGCQPEGNMIRADF